MKIACVLPGLTFRSTVPRFKYSFKEADVPIEIPKEHTEKLLKFKDLYEFGRSVKKTKKPPEKALKEEKEETQ